MNGMTRRLGIGVASIAAALVLVVGAGAAGRPQGMTQAEYKALMTRSAALNARYGNAVTRLSSAEFAALWRAGGWRLEPDELVALVERSEALNRHYGLGSRSATKSVELAAPSATPVQPGRDGFGWRDFGIGAGGMLGLVLITVGALFRFGRARPTARTS